MNLISFSTKTKGAHNFARRLWTVFTRFGISEAQTRKALYAIVDSLPKWVNFKRFTGHSLVGGFAFILGLAVLTLLVEVIHMAAVVAGVCSTIVSVETNFLLNRLNWKDRQSRFVNAWGKFHASRVVFLIVNQAIYSVLVSLGVHYLLVIISLNIMGVIINYFLNDRFVFLSEKKRESVEYELPESIPAVSVVITVGGNRTRSLDKLRKCIDSILYQDYLGFIEVILVIDPDNEVVRNMVLSYADLQNRLVRCVDYYRPPYYIGRDANSRWKCGWDNARYGLLASTGLSFIWAPDVVSKAVALMHTKNVEAVDGVTKNLPQDHSFYGLLREHAFISEFGSYKKDFLLTWETFASDMKLPILATFFMTRSFFEGVRDVITDFEHGWDDYYLANQMVKCSRGIYCSTSLVAYSNHGGSARLAKHFTAGIGLVMFSRFDRENKYARKRLALTVIAGALFASSLASAVLIIAFFGLTGLVSIVCFLASLLILLGIANAIKAHHWKGFFFPPVTILQVILFVVGGFYATLAKSLDKSFLEWVHSHR